MRRRFPVTAGALLSAATLAFTLGGCVPSEDPNGASSGAGEATCDTASADGMIHCVDARLYHEDLERITGVRPPGSEHWQEVQDLCAARLSELGFDVERHAYGTGVNVIGTLPGDDLASERVLVSAHYDHLEACPGADDNASGVAGVLELARVLAEGRYRRTAIVACWDQEERNALGSIAGSLSYATRARQADEPIVAAFVFDAIGYFSSRPDSQRMPPQLAQGFSEPMAQIARNQDRGDFVALVADPLSRASVGRLELHATALGLETVMFALSDEQMTDPGLSDLRRSDHAAFWSSSYPAILLTDTAEFRNPHYHCEGGPDAVEDLDDGFATDVIGATLGAVVEALELR